MAEVPSLSLQLPELPTSATNVYLSSSSSSSSSMFVLESQLISNAQRVLQALHGQVQTYHGDGWVLFQFAPIAGRDLLNSQVEELCETLVKDVAAKTSVVLTGEKEETSFAHITEHALPFVQFVNSMSESGQIPDMLSILEQSVVSDNDVCVTESETDVQKEKNSNKDDNSTNNNTVLNNMLSLIYSDLIQEVSKGVITVVDFPRSMCAGVGNRVDVIVQSRLCISAYSATTLDLGARDKFGEHEDASFSELGSALETSKRDNSLEYPRAKMNVLKLKNDNEISDIDSDDNEGDEDKDARKGGNSPTISSNIEAMKKTARNRAKEILDTSFLATSFSFAKLPSGPLGKIWIDVHALAAALLNCHANAMIEKILPVTWRTRAFALSEASQVLEEVHDALNWYWNRNSHNERIKMNALALLSIVCNDIRDYIKTQLMLYGAEWRGVWRIDLHSLTEITALCNQWKSAIVSLTHFEWKEWDGGQFRDEAFDNFASRLHDVAHIRQLLTSVVELKEVIPDSLQPEASLFINVSVSDLRTTSERTWNKAVSTFRREFSFLEPSLRNKCKQLFRSGLSGENLLRVLISHSHLLRHEGIRSAIEKDMEGIATLLHEELAKINANVEATYAACSLAMGHHSNTTTNIETKMESREDVFAQRQRVLAASRGAEAEFNYICDKALKLFGPNANTVKVIQEHAINLLDGLKVKETALLQNWRDDVEFTSEHVINDMSDAVVIDYLIHGGDLLRCTVNAELELFLREVHYLLPFINNSNNTKTVSGDMVRRLIPNTEDKILKCEELLLASRQTQRIVARFNTILQQILPVTREILRNSVERAKNQLFDRKETVRSLGVNHIADLQSINLRLDTAVTSCDNDNRQLRRFHVDLLRQVQDLFDVDLVKHTEQWRNAVDSMRSGFEAFVAQQHYEHYHRWRQYLDSQLYKALEFQYRKGLVCIHDTMEELKVEMVFKQNGVHFKPSFEAIKEAYYIKLREFISIPFRFRGLQAKKEGSSAVYEFYPLIPVINKEYIVQVHTQANELFSKLSKLRKAFRTQVVVGLCGSNGAPDLDALVQKWTRTYEAHHYPQVNEDNTAAAVKEDSKGKKRDKQKKSTTAPPSSAPQEESVYVTGIRTVRERLSKVAIIDDTMHLDRVSISTIPIKASITEQLNRLEEALSEALRQHTQQAIKEFDEFVFSASSVIERQPTTMDEIGKANKAFHEYREKLPSVEVKLREIERLNRDLKALSGNGIDLTSTRSRWEHLRETMQSHASVMESAVSKMRVTLHGLVQKFVKDVERYHGSWNRQKRLLMKAFAEKNTETVKNLLEVMKDQAKDLTDLTTHGHELQEKSDYFNHKRPTFGELDSVTEDITEMQAMLAMYDDFQAQLNSMRKEDWLTFRAHVYQFEDFCKEWRNTLQEQQEHEQQQQQQQQQHKSSKSETRKKDDHQNNNATDESATSVIANYVLELIAGWMEIVPLLRFIRGDGWMTEHWNELFRLLQLPKTISSTSLTLGDILDTHTELLAKQKEIKALHTRAYGETQIREALQELRTWALEATFKLITPSAMAAQSGNGETGNEKDKPIKLITEWKETMIQVSDNMALINSLKDSPFYANFADDASGWEVNLLTLSEALMQLNVIQRKWTYLEPIFRRGALPHEQARFKRIDKEFTTILREIEADPRVMSLTTQHDFVNRLKTMLEQIERCQRSLNEYLDAKRDKVPRFYFISDEDLLEILGHSSNPAVIQAHLKKLFMGIHTVKFNCDKSAITHMIASDGEVVPLVNPVTTAKIDVEDWLTELDSAMRRTLNEQLRVFHQIEDVYSYDLVRRCSSQILQVGMQVRFASAVESAIDNRELRRYSAQLQQQLNFYINCLSSAGKKNESKSSSSSQANASGMMQGETPVSRKLKALILDTIHCTEIVRELMTEEVHNVYEWWWQKQLRYYYYYSNNNRSIEGNDKKNKQTDKESYEEFSEEEERCEVCMVDAVFPYSYEYQGNAPKLVHTPLTDRCYLMLTQGMHLGYGGNPYGPAGTGKTESVKALGNAMGRQVLVFNCDEGIDFKSMGRILTGIVKCGAWGCFDEFNRLKIDQLSAISQMIQVIQEALKNRDATCALLGREIEVNNNAGIFVTMNPAGKGYGGRTKLPDNLKQLFREVSMSVPDDTLIAETMLLAEGFTHAEVLAKQVVELYKLCKQLLSQQQHYDWGLRPLKAVLQLSGTLLRREKEKALSNNNDDDDVDVVTADASINNTNNLVTLTESEEAEIVIQSLNINTISKLTYEDAKLFNGLLHDIFVQVAIREISYNELRAALASAATKLGLQLLPSQVTKALQFYEALNQRMGVVLVGPSGSGKSTLLALLRAALNMMNVEVELHMISPKAMPRHQLLGHMDVDTREWYDGVLTKAAKEAVQQPRSCRPWVVCDGDIDPEWIESLNSVLDDNKLLTMPNGVRIQFGSNVNFIFETHSLQFASPATVSRMGVIYFSENDVALEAVIESTLAVQSAEQQLSQRAFLMKYVLVVIDEVIRLGESAAIVHPLSRMNLLKSALLHTMGVTEEVEFVFALIRGITCMLTSESALQVANFIFTLSRGVVAPIALNKPLNSYFDRKRKKVVEFQSDAKLTSSMTPQSFIHGEVPIVSTIDVQRLMYTLQPLVHEVNCKPFCLVGPDGCGKTAVLRECYRGQSGVNFTIFNCSAETNASHVVQKIEQSCVMSNSANGRVYRPREGLKLVLIFKDINLPKPDKYGTVQLHAFLHQLITYRGFYNNELEWIGLEKIQIVATMSTRASPGRHSIDERLLSGLHLVSLSYPEKSSLLSIYGLYWSALLKITDVGLGNDYDNGQQIAQFMLNVYNKVRQRCQGEGYEHVIFSPRHLTTWTASALLYKINATTTLPVVLAYEGNRLFGDCLATEHDRSRVAKIISEQLPLLGFTSSSSFGLLSPKTVYVTWNVNVSSATEQGSHRVKSARKHVSNDNDSSNDDNNSETESINEDEDEDEDDSDNKQGKMTQNVYRSSSAQRLTELPLRSTPIESATSEVNTALVKYGREYKEMSMYLLEEIVMWIARLDRVLARSAGHAIVVGEPGVGRRDAVILAAYMQRMTLVSLNMTLEYNIKSFRNDLRSVIQRAIVQNTRVLLLLEDHNLITESFLEYINALVSSGGEVPGLFTNEEVETMLNGLREEANSNEGELYVGNIRSYYYHRLRQNLHIALVVDPRDECFLVRLHANPGLMSRCELLWFGTWSAKISTKLCAHRLAACLQESNKDKEGSYKYSKSNQAKDKSQIESDKRINDIKVEAELQKIHEAMGSQSTPKHLEMMTILYSNIITKKSESHTSNITRLDAGLSKLKESEASVEVIKKDVVAKKNEVEKMQKEADRALNEIQKKMEESQEQRSEAAELESKLKVEHEDIITKHRSVEEELGDIKPMMEAARDAVSSIRTEQLNEIRSLKAPPEPIRDVLEGVLALLGVVDISWQSMRNFLGERGVKERIIDFDVHTITPAIRNAVSKLLQQKGTSYRPEVIERASTAAAPMAQWVKAMVEYSTIMERIGPLTRQLEQLEINEREGEKRLAILRTTLQKIDASVAALREKFAAKCKEADKLRARLSRAEDDLHKAEELLNKLSAEKSRWVNEMELIKADRAMLPKRAIIAAAFMTYCGSCNEEIRLKHLHRWSEQVKLFPSSSPVTTALTSHSSPSTESELSEHEPFSFAQFMRTESELLEFKGEGLPGDLLSQENAVLVLDSNDATPLVIDPTGQALDWTRTHLSKRNVVVEVHSLHDERFAHILELAIRFGKTLLVTEVDHVPAMLFPVLRRDLYSAGAKRTVQVGNKVVDWQDCFQLILFSRGAEVQLSSDTAALIRLINFSVTSYGLESQLLGLTIQHEKPELEEEKMALLKKEQELKVELHKLEERLLSELATSHGNLLENRQLIASLDQVKTHATEVQESLKKSHALQEELDEKRNVYRPLAQKGSTLFFIIADLVKIDHMYQFGLSWFLYLFQETLQKYNGNDEAGVKVEQLTLKLAQTLLQQVGVALFKKDQLVFGLHFLHGLKPELFPRSLWAVFIGNDVLDAHTRSSSSRMVSGTRKRKDNTSESETNTANVEQGNVNDENENSTSMNTIALPSWVPSSSSSSSSLSVQSRINALAMVKEGRELIKKWELLTDNTKWSNWVRSALPEQMLMGKSSSSNSGGIINSKTDKSKGKIKQRSKKMNDSSDDESDNDNDNNSSNNDNGVKQEEQPAYSVMEQLLLIGLFRPDRLTALTMQVLLQQLQIQSIIPSFSLEEVVCNAHQSQPLLLITSSGADPSLEVQEMALHVIGKSHFTQIALGGGQTENAMQELRRCAAQGEWLFLKNVHLVLDWANVLEKELCAMPTPHDQFRLIITTEAHDCFPSVLLQMCKKMSVEAPPGMKQNILRTYRAWDKALVTNLQGHGSQMLFGLAWFHALVQERRTYVPQGWTVGYEFSPADLKAASDVLIKMSQEQEDIDWRTLEGVLESCLYGGRLDNVYDMEVLRQLIQAIFDEHILIRGTMYLYNNFAVPRTRNYDTIISTVQRQLPDIDPPVMLHLPDNADKVVQENAGTAMLSVLNTLATGVNEQLTGSVSSTTNNVESAIRSFDADHSNVRVCAKPILEKWEKSGLVQVNGSAMHISASSRDDPHPMEVFFTREVNLLRAIVEDVASFMSDLRAIGEGLLIPSNQQKMEVFELRENKVPRRWREMMPVMSDTISMDSWLALLASRHASALSFLRHPFASSGTVYDLTTMLRPHTFLNALRQFTARQNRQPLIDLILIGTAGQNELLDALKTRVCVKGSNIALQGIVITSNGKLLNTSAQSPSSMPLPFDITLGWMDSESVLPNSNTKLTDVMQNYLVIPVYSNAARTHELFTLFLPPTSRTEMDLVVNGVACYLM